MASFYRNPFIKAPFTTIAVYGCSIISAIKDSYCKSNLAFD